MQVSTRARGTIPRPSQSFATRGVRRICAAEGWQGEGWARDCRTAWKSTVDSCECPLPFEFCPWVRGAESDSQSNDLPRELRETAGFCGWVLPGMLWKGVLTRGG